MTTPNQRASRKQERRIERSLKQIAEETRRTMASGALWFQKSDVVNDMFHIECKTKIKSCKQRIIEKEWLDKVSLEGFESGKIGVLAFSFGDNKDYVAMDWDDFITIVEELNELRKKVEEYEEGADDKC